MKSLYAKKSGGFLLIWLVAVWLIVVASCIFFISGINKTASHEVDRYLEEISSGVALSVDSQIQGSFNLLSAIGNLYFEYLEDDADQALEFLERTALLHDIRQISISDMNGNMVWVHHPNPVPVAASLQGSGSQPVAGHNSLHLAEEAAPGSLSPSSYVPVSLIDMPELAPAFEGEMVFLRMRRSPLDGADVVICARPVYLHDRISGVVATWNDAARIKRYLHTPVLEGKGHFHIINTNGDMLLGPPAMKVAAPYNYFRLLGAHTSLNPEEVRQIGRRMFEGKSGGFTAVFSQAEERVVTYVPLNSRLAGHNLYLLASLPVEAAWAQFDALGREALLLVSIIVLLFTGLLLFYYVKDRSFTRRLFDVAFIDPVTGGMTYDLFELEAMPRIVAAPPGTFSLIAVDIRQFKLVNDMLGSVSADGLLKALHRCFLRYLEPDELLCRSHADDFVLLVNIKSKSKQLSLMNEFSEQVNREIAESGIRYKLYFSFGVYEITDNTLSLLTMLDRANFARKSSNIVVRGNSYECGMYSDVERLRMLKFKDIENKMDDALANRDFLVYLQPKVRLADMRVVGAEALVRWHDREAGIISPGDFIPCFEDNGFIIKLDLYIFEETCRIIRGWIDAGYKPVPVSVNLSRAHLLDPNFMDSYVQICDRYNIPHHLLEIELTESLLFENFGCLQNVVRRLHQLGFICSLDDFGSGYSSLNMLKEISVDSLKLDGAFWVSEGGDNQREKDIIAAVVALARKLGMKTVSEGVETSGQLEFLRQVNCDMVQGFVISKPVPPDEFEKMVYGSGKDSEFAFAD
ncbi:MAG: GGDEF domain-containing protein [Desulfovibrionaceae bacterium]|nr:GGDEF domain-containing protein [Desulfovibrionaceae bacterium]